MVQGQLFILGGKTAVVNGSSNDWIIRAADFQSVLVFDIKENKAITMATIGDPPDGTLGFSAVAAPDGTSIIIFGGHNPNATEFAPSQDVFLLDTCTLKWSKPSVGGNIPAARAGHQAVTYGNYMLVMLGYTDFNANDGHTYTNDISILDMSTWQWVDSINTQTTAPPSAQPSCRFTMPHMPDDGSDGGGDDGNELPYDPTVISNPNSSNVTAKAVGASLGVAGFLCIVGGFAFFLYRQRKDSRTPSPRWLPGALSRKAGKTQREAKANAASPINRTSQMSGADQQSQKSDTPLTSPHAVP
ncbi:hypothetical protein BCR43DRAFT_484428 [Syncephalastrum racemosum]|uniref:Galactose oxidase n=1 Tax=Syncephalastrum racemosum TaxID=13706 RepID=A0A1X2HM22_SYNRA|nr:hypothetical protein BCR43DRAFT_484428 [Syncephalastrum racemosum]